MHYFIFNLMMFPSRVVRGQDPCRSVCLIGGASFATNFVAVANENENAAECSPIPASYDTGGTTATSTSVVHQL